MCERGKVGVHLKRKAPHSAEIMPQTFHTS